MTVDLLDDRWERALRLAAVAHHDHVRRSSSVPYLTHPVAVARLVECVGFDRETIIAALLHDLVEDTDITLATIQDEFGAEVAPVVTEET